MDESYFWIVACLGCLLALVVLSAATCLFLVRRLGNLYRAQDATDQRTARLAYEIHRLELRISELNGRTLGFDPALTTLGPPADLISVPDLGEIGGEASLNGLAEKHGEVWSLIEQGLSTHEIARRTGKPIGQVELIAGLQRQHRATPAQGRHDDA